MHSQLKKDVANDYSKGNTNVYPTDIYKVLTLMNKYKPLNFGYSSRPCTGDCICHWWSRWQEQKARGQKSI
jgi:hypothetical protein